MGRTPISPELQDWVEIVVEENSEDLLRYFGRRVNRSEDAADLLGRVMLALWEDGAKVPTSTADARMWCFGIARNILREYYRHSARNITLADALRDHLRTVGRSDNSADIAGETNMRASEVRTAVASLDRKSSELVMLIHWDGFSIAQAARLLSINESTARTRHGRALQRLQKMLHEHRDSNAPDDTAVQPGLSSDNQQSAFPSSSA